MRKNAVVLDRDLKSSFEPLDKVSQQFTMQAMQIFLPQPLYYKILDVETSKSLVFFANIPGPTATLFYKGKEQKEMFGFSPTFFKMGLNLGLVSYRGRFRIAMTSD